MNSNQQVFVAMSGGVDSAVAVGKLLDFGYRVIGIHMRTWRDPVGQAEIQDLPDSEILAKKTAETLGIPFISLDIRDEFYQRVVKNFIWQYLQGLTPNPCLFCNPQIKWGILQSFALSKGADYFATGHYARLETDPSGKVRLLRGVDLEKDQSYVLSMLSQNQLSRSLLPLGGLTKGAVRVLAQEMALPVADRQDSQDLCFLGSVDYRDFLHRYAPESFEEGEIVDINGNVLGEHQGLALYTTGQRKGIRVAAPEPYFVIDKDVVSNRLVVGYAAQTGARALTAVNPNWVSGEMPAIGNTYQVMVRYRAKPALASLSMVTEEKFRLEFKKEIRGITPGQVAVLYQDEICLGGGVIQGSE